MKSLFNIFKEDISKDSLKWHHYFEVYEKHLSKYRNKDVKILEIGTKDGGSLQMWKNYFGSKCFIVGIDIEPSYKYEEEQIVVEIGSQSDKNFLKEIVDKYGSFDIIIDDGSHIQEDILTSFFFLYPFLNLDGCYCIEDLHTSYMGNFNGGLNVENNVVSRISNYVHDVNSTYIKEPYEKTLKNVSSISFYDSMIAIEKETPKDKYCVFSSNKKVHFQLGLSFLKLYCGFKDYE
jgi:23S rRNA U2552 (ribose-2'-O)-methylase RlmE/FtsJ